MSDSPSDIWTVRRLLEWTGPFLAKNHVDEPKLSAELLLAHVLGAKRLELILRREYQPTDAERATFRGLIKRRAEHEPIEYLVGSKPFYKFEFAVSPDVLIPRPETELLVEAVLEALAPAGKRFAGAGGSGTTGGSAASGDARPREGLGSGAFPAVGSAATADADFDPDEDDPDEDDHDEDDSNENEPDFEDGEFDEDELEGDAKPSRGPPSRSPARTEPSREPSEAARPTKLPLTTKAPTVVSRAAVRILDLCTGSGCVAVSLARELPGATVLATDISEAALTVARRNAQRLGVADRVRFFRGDLYDALPGGTSPMDIIVANPPYIPTAVIAGLDRNVREYEPHLALDGGADGLAIVRRLLSGAPGWLRPGGRLWVEIGHDQGLSAPALLAAVPGFAEISVRSDLARQPRVLTGRYMP